MDRLFAPWRIDWVERDGEESIDGCPFCVLPEREDARATRVVARNDGAYVLFNNFPYNPGHVMVIPFLHTGDYRDLDEPTLLAHAHMKQRTLDALESALDPDAFNTGTNLGGPAGGSITEHVHTHIVPRWAGDTNFMPVIGDTKVIVEAVDDTYDQVHDAFRQQEGGRADGLESTVRF